MQEPRHVAGVPCVSVLRIPCDAPRHSTSICPTLSSRYTLLVQCSHVCPPHSSLSLSVVLTFPPASTQWASPFIPRELAFFLRVSFFLAAMATTEKHAKEELDAAPAQISTGSGGPPKKPSGARSRKETISAYFTIAAAAFGLIRCARFSTFFSNSCLILVSAMVVSISSASIETYTLICYFHRPE